MDLDLRDKVAVVTASSKGLGKAIAEQLAAEGAKLALCSRDKEAISSLASSLSEQYGVQAIGWQADLADASSTKQFIDSVGKKFGQVDALVCNAGGPPSGKFLDMDDQVWEKAFQMNLMSVIRLIRGFVPYMKNNGGKVVSLTSSSVKMPIPNLVLSNTFRTGVVGLMKTLSMELAEYGILLNTVAPGRIQTDRVNELDQGAAQAAGKTMEEIAAGHIQNIPLGRYGNPKELAAITTFLLSPLNSYMTGSVYYVDGGLVKAI